VLWFSKEAANARGDEATIVEHGRIESISGAQEQGLDIEWQGREQYILLFHVGGLAASPPGQKGNRLSIVLCR
jgi:hypothetical protein